MVQVADLAFVLGARLKALCVGAEARDLDAPVRVPLADARTVFRMGDTFFEASQQVGAVARSQGSHGFGPWGGGLLHERQGFDGNLVVGAEVSREAAHERISETELNLLLDTAGDFGHREALGVDLLDLVGCEPDAPAADHEQTATRLEPEFGSLLRMIDLVAITGTAGIVRQSENPLH